jgi:formate dehydrogenase subunit gamma
MNQQPIKTEVEEVVQQALDDHSQRAGPLLPILRQVQEALRHIPSDAVGIIAKALNLSRAEVHGVVTFYHTFTSEPQGEHVIEVCRAESCQSMGGRAIESQFKKALGIDYGQTTQDGLITLEPVYCLGNCGCSPSVRVGDNIYGRVNADKVDSLVAELFSSSKSGA